MKKAKKDYLKVAKIRLVWERDGKIKPENRLLGIVRGKGKGKRSNCYTFDQASTEVYWTYARDAMNCRSQLYVVLASISKTVPMRKKP